MMPLARSVPQTTTAYGPNGLNPEEHSKHKRVMAIYDLQPELNDSVYIAHNASVIGEVYFDSDVNVWERAVVRGDLQAVRLGFKVSIREGTCISTVSTIPLGLPSFVSIGRSDDNQ